MTLSTELQRCADGIAEADGMLRHLATNHQNLAPQLDPILKRLQQAAVSAMVGESMAHELTQRAGAREKPAAPHVDATGLVKTLDGLTAAVVALADAHQAPPPTPPAPPPPLPAPPAPAPQPLRAVDLFPGVQLFTTEYVSAALGLTFGALHVLCKRQWGGMVTGLELDGWRVVIGSPGPDGRRRRIKWALISELPADGNTAQESPAADGKDPGTDGPEAVA